LIDTDLQGSMHTAKVESVFENSEKNLPLRPLTNTARYFDGGKAILPPQPFEFLLVRKNLGIFPGLSFYVTVLRL
jgi:hypothetical protein